jgi:hypothetical protein
MMKLWRKILSQKAQAVKGGSRFWQGDKRVMKGRREPCSKTVVLTRRRMKG